MAVTCRAPRRRRGQSRGAGQGLTGQRGAHRPIARLPGLETQQGVQIRDTEEKVRLGEDQGPQGHRSPEGREGGRAGED